MIVSKLLSDFSLKMTKNSFFLLITAFISCLWKCKYNCKRGRWWRHDSLQFHISYHQANLSSLHWNYTHRGGFTSLRLVKHGRNGFLDPLCEIPGVVIDLQGLQIFISGIVLCPSLKLKKVWMYRAFFPPIH